MDLSTTYLGMRLPHPLMPGASPMVDDLDTVRRLEDAGAAAIVMHSLFEEQLVAEQLAAMQSLDSHEDAFAEELSYFPGTEEFRLGPEEYLEQIQRIKSSVELPLIASLNGMSPGGWLNFSALIQQAGADALELNVYYLATEVAESGGAVEERTLEMFREVKRVVRIPVAVKLSPYYSALAHFAAELDRAGADGLVLFNRFYQPDIDIEELKVERQPHLSDSSELPLRLRWLAVLWGNVDATLAASGGVHTDLDAIKAVLSGAHAVQMVSALLREGPQHLSRVRQGMAEWLEEHEYDSLEQMRGSMSLSRCPDPKAYERANYMEILQHWEPPHA
jgi:dihydroorotate dehydrogenase (fumarate)